MSCMRSFRRLFSPYKRVFSSSSILLPLYCLASFLTERLTAALLGVWSPPYPFNACAA
jgi:hypothetical protein